MGIVDKFFYITSWILFNSPRQDSATSTTPCILAHQLKAFSCKVCFMQTNQYVPASHAQIKWHIPYRYSSETRNGEKERNQNKKIGNNRGILSGFMLHDILVC